MRYLLLVLLLVSGCSSTPIAVERHMPDPAPVLMKKCEELSAIEGDKVSVIDFLKVVVANYKTYYACSTKVDGWQDWYKDQKEIFDSVK
jgi:hypothetical protein